MGMDKTEIRDRNRKQFNSAKWKGFISILFDGKWWVWETKGERSYTINDAFIKNHSHFW